MRRIWSVLLGSLLILALFSQSGSLVAALLYDNKGFNADFSFNRLNRMYFNDSSVVSAIEEFYGSTETPEHEALEVHASSDPAFEYMAHSPYYKVFFKGSEMKVVVGDSWISLSLLDQELGEVAGQSRTPTENACTVQDIFEDVDLSYEVTTSRLQEMLILESKKELIYEVVNKSEHALLEL